ncbi:LacI family DNA-binding transcriptional regulator [candidate division KSB1 bacterium]|nr:LacI family DNA-binding transcriptional regulator [candidate division KSB1 bacterium]
MKKKVTIKDLARMADVTAATVSMVLNGKTSISEATRKKVLALAEMHQYVPNISARGLVKAGTNSIGIIMPDLVEPFNAAVLRAISTSVMPTGYRLLLYDVFATANWEETLYHRISSEGRVDGIIHKALEMTECDLKRLETLQLPMVVFENELSWVDCVAVDNEEGAYLATQYLLSKGHKQIGLIGCDMASQVIAARVTGAKRALREADLQFDVQHYFSTKSFTANEGMAAADYFHGLSNKPTALFVIAGDYVACGVLACLRKLDYEIPRDFAVIGFDGLELSSFLYPQLTTVQQPIDKMADAAIALLLQRIQERDKPTEIRKFKTKMIIRESA